MGIFNKSKIKVKEKVLEKGINYFIDYSCIKNEKALKFHIIKSIAENNKILVIIDTRLFYENINKNYQKQIEELLDIFNRNCVKYKTVKFDSQDDITIFGIKINADLKKIKTDHLIGFVVEAADLDEIKSIINDFTLRFYISPNEHNEDELLNLFMSNQNSFEALQDLFDINILNDSLSKKLIIFSKQKSSDHIKEAIEAINISLGLL